MFVFVLPVKRIRSTLFRRVENDKKQNEKKEEQKNKNVEEIDVKNILFFCYRMKMMNIQVI